MVENVQIGEFQTEEAFQNPDTLKRLLAQQLCSGRLVLVLGAGVSMGFGLPNWDTLTSRIAKHTGIEVAPGLSNEDIAEVVLRTYFKEDEIAFAECVRSVLYENYDTSLQALRKKDLLTSLGALTMASMRGSVTQVVSFNFDDLLEVYLMYLGFDIETIPQVPCWSSRADVRVFHPHGFLPSDKRTLIRSPIVFAKTHYDKVVDKSDWVWRGPLLEIFSSSTCLFVGLSGNDDNLSSILTQVKNEHVSKGRGDKYWGIRFARMDDPQAVMWEGRGVFPQPVNEYDDIPAWLFEVCQIAASFHRQSQYR